MKTRKLLSGITFGILLTVFSTALQAQDIIITKNELPQTAQNFITKYFGNQTINYIKKDKDLLSVDYEVKFNNRMEVNFDSKGNWEEVDGKNQNIPTGFISKKIINYINKQFPGTQITKIEKKSFKLEVNISNGLELIFNSSGDFIKLDD